MSGGGNMAKSRFSGVNIDKPHRRPNVPAATRVVKPRKEKEKNDRIVFPDLTKLWR